MCMSSMLSRNFLPGSLLASGSAKPGQILVFTVLINVVIINISVDVNGYDLGDEVVARADNVRIIDS